MRFLFIDSVPKDWDLKNVVMISSVKDVEFLYEKYFHLTEPVSITLDCRSASTQVFNQLLRFVEVYRGEIKAIAGDPVPLPFLSRFSHVGKRFEPLGGSIVELRLRKVSGVMREKLVSLFSREES